MVRQFFAVTIGLISSILLVGCARPLYYSWGSYMDSVHAQLNDPGEYILDEDIERLGTEIEATPRQRVPPGKAAHLGYLYSLRGDRSNAKRYFEYERSLFPESETLMNRLIARVERKH